MRLDLVVDVVDRPMLQSGSTSVLGRAYHVDEVLPLPILVGCGGVVDLLGIPAARRRGGGGGGETLQGFAKPGTEVWRRERGGGQLGGFKGVAGPLPLPLLL